MLSIYLSIYISCIYHILISFWAVCKVGHFFIHLQEPQAATPRSPRATTPAVTQPAQVGNWRGNKGAKDSNISRKHPDSPTPLLCCTLGDIKR